MLCVLSCHQRVAEEIACQFQRLFLFRLGSYITQDLAQREKSRKMFLGKADSDCAN